VPSGTCREGFARPSTSKRQSEDLQTSAPLPNPALMRNQGGAGGATGPASAPGLCLGGARPGARRATPLGHADQPSSRVRQLGAGSWLPRAPSSSPAHRVSRLRPGHVIDFAGGPHSPPAQLGLASRCRPPLPLGTTAERRPGYQDRWALPDREPLCDDFHTKAARPSGPAVRKLRTEGSAA
jgi:hypothetical protein